MARPTSRVCRVLLTGPLAPFADAYRAELLERGYTPLSVVTEASAGEAVQPVARSWWVGRRRGWPRCVSRGSSRVSARAGVTVTRFCRGRA